MLATIAEREIKQENQLDTTFKSSCYGGKAKIPSLNLPGVALTTEAFIQSKEIEYESFKKIKNKLFLNKLLFQPDTCSIVGSMVGAIVASNNPIDFHGLPVTHLINLATIVGFTYALLTSVKNKVSFITKDLKILAWLHRFLQTRIFK